MPVFEKNQRNVVPFSVWTYGRIEINFQYMQEKAPFDETTKRGELAHRIEEILGIHIPAEAQTKRPSFQLDLLLDQQRRTEFLALMKQTAEEITG